MSDKTGIAWTDASWNPVTGCSKVSPGCANCYAETLEREDRLGRLVILWRRLTRRAIPYRDRWA